MPAADVQAAALGVVRAFVAYQDAALPADSGEFMLIADDTQTYVGVTRGVTEVLGYQPEDLIGQRISDLAAHDIREATPAQWQAFLADGRQDGRFRLLAATGQPVSLLYQARAHHPVPGFHMSRLWPDEVTEDVTR
jgi:PAS domain S-box-containing protein